jgi:hypothetical protein
MTTNLVILDYGQEIVVNFPRPSKAIDLNTTGTYPVVIKANLDIHMCRRRQCRRISGVLSRVNFLVEACWSGWSHCLSRWIPMSAGLNCSVLLVWFLMPSSGITAPLPPPLWTLQARMVATGLVGAYGIRQVGRFHTGGPFASNPEFLMRTQPGHVLDPRRLLVAVDEDGGMLLSIDPAANALAVPRGVATKRASTGGLLQVYSTRDVPNGARNSGALTAAEASVASPRYVSINNAFGRPWIANAPHGLRGEGTESVVDPDGAPLANAPSDTAGGVFVGARTPRTSVSRTVRTGWFANLFNRRNSAQLTPGDLGQGAYGTALLGPSPDGSGFAVFATVTGRGAVVQVHVQDGVDGLAPPGTIDVGDVDPGVIGIAFKWAPDRALFVADARRSCITVLHLRDDTHHFVLQRTEYIESPWLQAPVDLSPAMPEGANPRFSSHTTLAASADLLVANRGDGTLLRLAQDGRVLARGRIVRPDGSAVQSRELRAMAVSFDGRRIWVIARRNGHSDDELLETTSFDAQGKFDAPARAQVGSVSSGTADVTAVADGRHLFSTSFTERNGLGRTFNATACITCHPGIDGASTHEAHFARRVARLDGMTGRLLAMGSESSTIAALHAVDQEVVLPLPRDANVVSLRMPLSLVAARHIDEIDDAEIEAQAVAKGDGIHGRTHRIAQADGSSRVGRYGWKADVVTLDAMVAQAFTIELGLTSALSPHARPPFRDDGVMARAVASFLRAGRRSETAP